MDRKQRKGIPGGLAELLTVSMILLLCCVAGAVILFFHPDRSETIPEAATLPAKEAEKTEQKLKLLPQDKPGVIQLPSAREQKIDCDTAARRLVVSMQGAPEEEEPWIKADQTLLASASLYRSAEESLYVFELKDMCVAERETTAEGLQVRLTPVAELDAGCFVVILECADESVPEELLRRTEEKIAASETNIVLMRMGSANAPKTEEEREALIKNCHADAYIRLETAEKTGRGYVTQAFCNTQYYIPGLDSMMLADICESSMLEAMEGPAGDIADLAEDDPLRSLRIPACVLRLGKSAEDQAGADIKNRNAYTEKAAEGLKDALIRAAGQERIGSIQE